MLYNYIRSFNVKTAPGSISVAFRAMVSAKEFEGGS
jgi:hypothetical protein